MGGKPSRADAPGATTAAATAGARHLKEGHETTSTTMHSSDGTETQSGGVSRVSQSGSLALDGRVKMTFPMSVVPRDVVKGAHAFLPHEELMEKGLLREWCEGLGDVIFFSHVWLSVEHPDPDGVQWQVLKEVFLSLSSGARKVRVFWQQEFLFGPVSMQKEFAGVEYCWVDYLCVPQDPRNRVQQTECIKNIYAYVCASTHFVVIVPPAVHKERRTVCDYNTWESRGWCRAEMFCNSIAKSGKVLVAESATRIYIDMAGGRDALLKPVGMGKFTNDSDKEALGPVLESLLDLGIRDRFANGEVTMARILKASRGHLLAGMTSMEAEYRDLDHWLADYEFQSPLDGQGRGGTGWTPFRYAVYEGRYDIAKQLLSARADVEAPLAAAFPGVGYHGKDTSVLCGLSFMRDDPEGIRFLLENRASVQHMAENDLSPLHMCSVVGHIENAKVLLELGADLHFLNKFGDDAAGSAIFGGQREIATWLISTGSKTLETKSAFGWRSVFSSLVCAGDVETLKAVIELKGDVNFKCSPQAGFGQIMCAAMQAAHYYQWRDSSEVVDLFSQVPGMTPLGLAAMRGNVEVISRLLDARADCSITNDYGRTPLHQAAIKGHAGPLVLLAEAAPGTIEAKDCWGRTAASWAMIQEHGDALQALMELGAHVPKAARGKFLGSRACCERPTVDQIEGEQ